MVHLGGKEHVEPGHGEAHSVTDIHVWRHFAVPSSVPENTFFQQDRRIKDIPPSINNFGAVLLFRGYLASGILGDGIKVRAEDCVISRIQKHAVTRGLKKVE